MRPIEFPQMNRTWAKDQPEYQPLPAFTNAEETISLWALSWRERIRVLWTGRVWLRQLHYGQSLQPQLIEVTSPFSIPREPQHDDE